MPGTDVSFSIESAPIRVLDDAVISGIAAGEVIERPASVVKELVENALDAGASRIEVGYSDGERLDISVIDDGGGIAAEQLDLAVRRHATSKLAKLDDLRTIRTFGFRGEALASIAAVARLELTSRIAGHAAASGIRVLGGQIVDRFDAPGRVGTKVSLQGLFETVPARKKFLRSVGAEFVAVADVLRRFSLLHPACHFRLLRNQQVSLDLPATRDVLTRLGQVLDAEIAGIMHPMAASYAGMGLRGAVSAAGFSLGSARRIFLFVNGRWVQDKALFRAVMEAYRTYLLKGRYPAVALFLEVPGERLDVNVHPAKLEVRFADLDGVQRFVIEAVRETLRGQASPLGRWGLTEGDLLASEVQARRRGASATRGSGDSASAGVAVKEPLLPGYRESTAAENAAAPESPLELTLGPEAGAQVEVIGQVLAGYIVCEHAGEVLLIDQHAAHERIIFEDLLRAYLDGKVLSQALLVPLNVQVGGAGAEAVAGAAGELGQLGWSIERLGDEDVVVRAVPALVAGRDLAALVERLASELARSDAYSAGTALAREVIATVACHAATRVGQRLDLLAARALVASVAIADFAASCPHGRPVARRLDRKRIERMFGR